MEKVNLKGDDIRAIERNSVVLITLYKQFNSGFGKYLRENGLYGDHFKRIMRFILVLKNKNSLNVP